MIDINGEDILDLQQARREPVFCNPRTKQPAHFSTILRYVTSGARDVHGDVVKLESFRAPAGLRTSRQAIARFVSALSGETVEALPVQRGKSRKRAADRAEAELEAIGI